MLPELLFPVMQDISRDEFSILSGSGGSGLLSTTGATTVCDNSLIKSPIKLEDLENYSSSSWKSPNLCNLLRNSEDPLISGGTTNENHQNELKSITESPSPPITPTIAPIKTTNIQSRNRKSKCVRKKGQLKLRFHHQALPQEYLEHYETQNRNNNNNNNNNNNIIIKKSDFNEQNIDVNDDDDETNVNSVRNWLQKINDVHDDDISLTLVKNESDVESIKIRLPVQQTTNTTRNTTSSITSSRVCNYNDLPYMGEMTLENSKPRRGRKPKKADICHLIYKNYGQIFPGTPLNSQGGVGQIVNNNTNNNNNNHNNNNKNNVSTSSVSTKVKNENETNKSSGLHKKTTIQNKILSSLLEKRLTQNLQPSKKLTDKLLKNEIDEPLNLCLRDSDKKINPLLIPSSPTLSHGSTSSISLHGDDLDNADDDDDDDCDDDDNDDLLVIDKNQPLDIAKEPIFANEKVKTNKKLQNSEQNIKNNENFVVLPNGNVFINPLALYYKKDRENENVKTDGGGVKQGKIVAKDISELIAKRENVCKIKNLIKTPTPSTTPSSIKSIESCSSSVSSSSSSTTLASSNTLRSVILSSSSSPNPNSNQLSSGGTTTVPTQKRKRSAIFIPPMPAENTSNPTTEVSICKFKFTGGAKPSLQEKKMLSVDSGGNFRYYSGTGDKSMRGYEFFPRESLHQSSLMTGGSSSGAFLNTPGEKIITEDPYPSLDLTTDVLQIPNFSPPPPTPQPPQSSVVSSPAIITSEQSPTSLINKTSINSTPLSSTTTPTSSIILPTSHHSSSRSSLDRKSKRKSRRSLQREKLEKTFKEKGFLIQTEHVEAAGGSTYCKFRQLRRFTRYLFRSWKDYLPGDIQQSGANQI